MPPMPPPAMGVARASREAGEHRAATWQVPHGARVRDASGSTSVAGAQRGRSEQVEGVQRVGSWQTRRTILACLVEGEQGREGEG
eukprot:37248-Pleurochrysis_carterae.AAC.1